MKNDPTRPMPYQLTTPDDQRAMLAVIGAASVEELFQPIPAEHRLGRPLKVGPALDEFSLSRHMQRLASKNTSANQSICFLGGGSYDHFIPAAVDQLAGRGEFYTSYTPYQAEASQGNLQVFFEYQTLVAQLTGMDVSNSSLYEAATAVVEAVLMSINATGRKDRVLMLDTVHPEYRETVKTYVANLGIEVVVVPTTQGVADPAAVAEACKTPAACLVIQQPNFFGGLEAAKELVAAAKESGALAIVAADPVSLGLLPRPGDYGADIVVCEGQGLGNPMSYGGPYLGMIACRESLMRRMPGRLVGETTDRAGRRCWVLTLQTREQHIRRDKATSNICTNQGLFALRTTIHLSLIGPKGLQACAELCARKARYAADRLSEVDGAELRFPGRFFKEFALKTRRSDAADLVDELTEQGILAGVPLGPWYPQYADTLLVAVTEKRTRCEIDFLASSVRQALAGAVCGAAG